MPTEFQILTIDSSAGAPPGPPGVSLQSLREAVLAHPSLALQALKYAIESDTEVPAVSQMGAFSGQLPLDTPIFKMLTEDQAALLSPAAMKLTKADLLALQSGAKLSDFNLTFDDLKTVEEAFHQNFDTSGLKAVESADGISCCCCTPCCCCTAAAMPPLAAVA